MNIKRKEEGLKLLIDCIKVHIRFFDPMISLTCRLILATPLFLIGIIAPVKADSVWLIMKEVVSRGESFGIAIEKLEMKDLNQCEEQGAKYIVSKKLGKWRDSGGYTGYTCLEGK